MCTENFTCRVIILYNLNVKNALNNCKIFISIVKFNKNYIRKEDDANEYEEKGGQKENSFRCEGYL